MYFRLTGTTVRLAWVIEIEQTDALHWWLVTVDAKSGEVLDTQDWVQSARPDPGKTG